MSVDPSLLSGVPYADYHAGKLPPGDPCPPEYLSASVATRLVSESPAHACAYYKNQVEEDEDSQRAKSRKEGSLLHAMILGGGQGIQCLAFDSWRTNASKDARDEARSNGLVPVLLEQFLKLEEKAKIIEEKVREALEDGDNYENSFDLDLIQKEVTVTWDENGIACKGRLDGLYVDQSRVRIFDLKFLESADPVRFGLSIPRRGYDIQAEAYCRGLVACLPSLAGREDFEFVLCEKRYPYVVSRTDRSGRTKALGRVRLNRAIKIWGQCQKSGIWPGYVPAGKVATVDVPEWAMRDVVADEDIAWARGEER